MVIYGSQADLQAQLDARVDSVLRLPPRRPRSHHGDDARAGRADRARRAGGDGGARRSRPRSTPCRKRVAGKPRPRTLLVFGREPGSLRNIYASGGRGFLHDMLDAAGGDDVLHDIDKESVQVSTEMILARAPDVILELNAADAAERRGPQGGASIRGSTLSSVPAVRNKRVIILDGRAASPCPARASLDGIETDGRGRCTRDVESAIDR